jgi:hypothetical protein
MIMRKLRKKLKEKPYLALSAPAVLYFVAFIINFVSSLKDWNIDASEMHQLLAYVDGFQAVALIIIMAALHQKKK